MASTRFKTYTSGGRCRFVQIRVVVRFLNVCRAATRARGTPLHPYLEQSLSILSFALTRAPSADEFQLRAVETHVAVVRVCYEWVSQPLYLEGKSF